MEVMFALYTVEKTSHTVAWTNINAYVNAYSLAVKAASTALARASAFAGVHAGILGFYIVPGFFCR